MEDDASSTQTHSAANPSSTGNTPQGASTSQSGASGTPSQRIPTPGPSLPPSNTASHPPGSQNSKRRRGLGVVTPNACTECRKKRAKVCYVSWHVPPPRSAHALCSTICFSFKIGHASLLHNSMLTDSFCSAMARDLVAVAGRKRKLSASMRFPFASPKRIYVRKLRRYVAANDQVIMFWLRL